MNEQTLFAEALERADLRERAAFLDNACRGDPALRQRLERLLAQHQHAGGFLESPPVAPAPTVDDPVTERPGTKIGPYKLLEQIGEGGFGVVFLAEQTEPVRRKVALKVLKPGMDTRSVVARFEAERQALAIMDHPNIARVFDGGATTSGRPYFVMELVRGVPITDFCDQNHLTPRQRLELFIGVCQAVQHAHLKGIIHRDLKPSNVLVSRHDSTPIVKVIDFGIAKALGQELTDKTLFTGIAQMVGTPLYMSPEQAGMSDLDVDTRSDIYSLGVLLYELLTGTTPFGKERFGKAGYDEIRRIIREEEPPRPSTRLSESKDTLPSISAQRQMEPAKLIKLMHGELDWIVMKALEKDRTRRYETASGFALDVQRYLTDEPVQACPPSAGYRLRKFVRRNRRALTMTAVVTGALLLTVGTLAGIVRDRAARHTVLEQEVVRALEDAESAYRADKLPAAMANVQRAIGLLAGGPGSEELRRRVDRWRIDLEMVGRLREIRLERAAAREGHGDQVSAERAYQKAFLDYGLDVETPDPAEAVERIRDSSIRDSLAAALDDWVLSRGRLGARARDNLVAVVRQGDPDPWRDQLRGAIQRMDGSGRKILADLARDRRALAQPTATIVLMAGALQGVGEAALAVDLLRQANRQHPDDFWITFSLGNGLNALNLGESLGFLRAAVALRPDSAMAKTNLAIALYAQGQPAEAEFFCREALHLEPDNARARYERGRILFSQQRWAEAEAEYREVCRIDPNAYWAYFALSLVLSQSNRDLPGAADALQSAVRLQPANPFYRWYLGEALLRLGRLAEAEAEWVAADRLKPAWALVQKPLEHLRGLRKGLEEIRRMPNVAWLHVQVGNRYLGLRMPAAAEIAFREAARRMPENTGNRYGLALALLQQSKLNEAAAEFREGLRITPNWAIGQFELGRIHASRGQWDSAAAAFGKGLECYVEQGLDRKDPDASFRWYCTAAVRLHTGDIEGYRRTCREMLERFGQAKELAPAEFTARVCLLAPDAVADQALLLRCADRAFLASVRQRDQASYLLKALADHRAGLHADALAWLKRRSPKAPSPGSDAQALAVQALAHHRLGQPAEARAALDKAQLLLATNRPNPDRAQPFDSTWIEWLHGEILHREAAALLKK